jgi:hypothetical protein
MITIDVAIIRGGALESVVNIKVVEEPNEATRNGRDNLKQVRENGMGIQ